MITVFLSLYRKDMWDYYSRTGEIKKKKKKRKKWKNATLDSTKNAESKPKRTHNRINHEGIYYFWLILSF